MSRYARETVVPVEKSRAEIERVLRKYSADEFQTGWSADAAFIAFRIRSLFIRFVLPLPSREEKRFTMKKDRWGSLVKRSEDQAAREWEQEIRSRWRALLLVIKAKLEAVECGISSIEKEFLAFIIMPNDLTLGDWIIETALPQIAVGQMPKLLPAPKAETIDAEIISRTERQQ